MENIRLGKQDASDEKVKELQSLPIVWTSSRICRMVTIQLLVRTELSYQAEKDKDYQ